MYAEEAYKRLAESMPGLFAARRLAPRAFRRRTSTAAGRRTRIAERLPWRRTSLSIRLVSLSYQLGYLLLDGLKEEHALYRRLALDGVGQDVVHDFRDGAHLLGRPPAGSAPLAAAAPLLLRIGQGQLLLSCLELPFRLLPVAGDRHLLRQHDVHLFLAGGTYPGAGGRV